MNTTSKLPFHEWCIILLFCLILLALSAFALMGRRTIPLPKPVEPKASVLEVKIEGEVAHPGLYQLPLKSTLKELLAQAEPLPTADLSKLSLRKRLHDGQTVKIPEKKWITIQLAGLVQQPGPMKIMSGTRIQELVGELQLLPEADVKALSKRKSFLFEGDTIDVPAKKAKKAKANKLQAATRHMIYHSFC